MKGIRINGEGKIEAADLALTLAITSFRVFYFLTCFGKNSIFI